jgi:hypothetical protein
MLGLIDYYSSEIKNNTNTSDLIHNMFSPGAEIYFINGENIYNLLTKKSKNFIDTIDTTNIFSAKDIIWENIVEIDKIRISNLIKNIVKRGNVQPVSFLDTQLELPYLLEYLYNNNDMDIILIDFNLNKFINKYDNVTIHTRINKIPVNENTLFGFITTEGHHTNIFYNQLFKIEEVPEKIRAPFLEILSTIV